MADQIKEKMFAAYPFVPLQDIVVKTVQKTEGKGKNKVRTDGNRVIFAQKLERKATNGYTWDIHKLEWNEKKGEFELVGAK